MEEDAYEVVTHYANAQELAGRRDAYRKEGKALGLTEGKALGSDEKTRRIVRNMINRGMDDADIMTIAECGPKLIREMRSRRKR